MTNCTNNERDEQLRQQKKLLRQYVKKLHKMNMDISDFKKSIQDLKAMMLQNMKDKSNLPSGSLSYFSTLRIQQEDNHIILDDSEGHDDARAFFPCPFCYVDIEVPVLCNHLQEEHCFDLKNAVCPLCAANLGKDVTGHFTVQHAHSLKRRRKSHKSGLWTSSSSLGNELRELSSFLGSTSKNSRGTTHESTPDPLLSPFLCSIPLSDPEGNPQDEFFSNNASVASAVKSTKRSTLDEVHKQDYEERRQRTEYVRQLISSTIF